MKSIKDILEAAKMKGADPCWKGYQMVGMKDKGGKKVPNCVPEEVQQEGAVPASEKIITVKHKTSGKTLRISANAAQKYRTMGYHYHPVNEAKDEQEYGYEGDMALNQLATLTRCADMIKDLLKPDTDMPEWVQSKITLATDYIQTAADYLYSEMKESVELDESHKVGDSVIVNSKFFGKQKGKVVKVDNQSVHVQRNDKKYSEKYPHDSVMKEEVEPIEELSKDTLKSYAGEALRIKNLQNKKGELRVFQRHEGSKRALNRLYPLPTQKESADSDGGPPTEAASTLTITGQPKLTKTVGQSKLIPYVQEGKETKPPFDKPYTTTKAVVKDKSGAKHTPMSRARDLARKAMAKKMEEQSNIEPNPFTIPSSNPGDAPEKKVKKASPVAPTAMAESRQLEIVREAMKVAKKKKEVTEAGTDKFIADPELSSQITKSNP